jgi:glycosyltransferase involved in cell wall biosynthesis
LTVIVPVFNEQHTVDALLQRVVDAPCDKQIVVVDDGSRDGTTEVLAGWRGRPGVDVLGHAVNRGKGAAIRTGLEHARGQFTLVQDADLEYDPQEYPMLLDPLLRGDADVVYGSRYLRTPRVAGASRLFRCGVSLLNLCVRYWYGVRLTDEATCYKVFPTPVLRAMRLECQRFEFCPEVTAKACRMGLSILEVPIRYAPRAVAEGKKIRWTDGLQAVAELWRWRRWRPRPVAALQPPHAWAVT